MKNNKNIVSDKLKGNLVKLIRAKIKDENIFSNNHKGALARLKSRNLEISSFIDIGASDGRWTSQTMEYFPTSVFFLLEANKNHEDRLNQFVKQNDNSHYLISAAGDTDGEIFFDASENNDFGGVATHKKTNASKKVDSVTIDSCVKKYNLKPPYALKFDTHGFELKILQGCKQTLKDTKLIIMELYNFDISDDSIKFYDMCKYMEKLGFRPIDMAEPLWRNYDYSLWQMDFYFVPITSKEFQYNNFE